MRAPRARALIAATAISSLACAGDSPPIAPGDVEEPDTLPVPLAGGALTVFDASSSAYDLPAPALAGARVQLHFDGRQGFSARFNPAPHAVDPGLGPLFNEPSCVACHRRSGRTPGVRLLRMSAGGTGGDGGPKGVAGFGVQLQDKAIDGFEPEGRLEVSWATSTGAYPDGTRYELRRPQIRVERPYAPFSAPELGLRTPRPVFGLGLLEAVPASALEALADPGDANRDGISGRINRVPDLVGSGTGVGRFGWKAGQPSLVQQTDAAYLEDMGVTTSLYPAEATAGQPGGEDGLDDDPELSDADVDEVVFFVRTLGVPARRDVNDPGVRRGEALFDSVGCAACHRPALRSGPVAGMPEISDQTFFPYTDLLLHDMGEGLADGRPEYGAAGGEWRTPPLWGIGLAEVVTVDAGYLHDGRARSLEEAILWHGGEAQAARDRFRNLSAAQRTALLRFLGSL